MRIQDFLTALTVFLPIVKGKSQAIDGGYSPWSEFSECNASCGKGVKTRARLCNSPEPSNGGKNCTGLGQAVEYQACNSFPCPVHGGYSQWSNFTKCSVTCGEGYQTRSRTCTNPLPCCGGRNCEDLGPSVETRTCGTCKCVTDGGYSEWCPFTSCSVSCGGGVRYRNRTCTNPSPQNGGRDCQHLGPAVESQECNMQSCNQGNYTEWTNWSECSATCGVGAQIRSRTCTNPPSKPGEKDCKEAFGAAQESRQCGKAPCPIDGNYTEWTKWSPCSASCGGGSKTRIRSCTNPSPQHGGKNCVELGSASETVKCNPDLCPTDGNYTEWTKWSNCSATCGGGFKTRTRACSNPPPRNGGKNCVELGSASETVKCSSDPCPADGNYTEWTKWSDCSATCGGGLKTRTRSCTNPLPQHGGKNCVELGSDTETVKCSPDPCPIDGNYTEWTKWSDCSASCGGGSKMRTRACTNPPPQYSGKTCVELGPASETVNCSLEPCPTDGNYSEWTNWSDCSTSCGGGSKTRVRTCINPSPQHGGKNCVELGFASETVECNPNPCPLPCAGGLDIGLVVDKSKSISKNNMKLVRESLVNLVDNFNPAPDKDHFGLITFNRKASINFTFADKKLYDKGQLEKRIAEMSLGRAFKTRTDLAMKTARDKLFSAIGGDRPDKPNVMIVLTDGKPQGQPKGFSFEKFSADFYQDPKVAGLYTVAVGIGTGINDEVLRQIAGENGTVFATEGFEKLAAELPDIKNKICG